MKAVDTGPMTDKDDRRLRILADNLKLYGKVPTGDDLHWLKTRTR
jgi:hypothetical protein